MIKRIRDKIYDIKQNKLDYTITDMERRKEIVDEILAELDDYLNLYFYGDVSDKLYDSCERFEKEYFDYNATMENEKDLNRLFEVSPNCMTADQIHTAEKLSESDFVCKFLEQLANYMIYDGKLNNDERKQNRFEKTNVTNDTTLHSSGDKLRTDGSAQAKRDYNTIENISGEAPDFEGNFKKDLKQKIFKEDLEKSKILREYQEFRVKIGNKKRNGEIKDKKKINMINRALASMKDDMIYIKDFEFGTIYFREPLRDDGQSNQIYVLTDDMFYEDMRYQEKDLVADFWNHQHYATILKILPFCGLSDNLKKIGKKFKMLECYLELNDDKAKLLEILKEGKITGMDNLYKVPKEFKSKRECIVQNKRALYDVSSLSDKLDWDYAKTKGMFDRLCKDCHEAFVKMFENEFYYMDIIHGNYKQCSRCGDIKLIQEFDKNANSKDGYRNICKRCRKNV